MDEDVIARLNQLSEQLHTRALVLSHPNQDHDMAKLMSGLAVTMEAVRSLGMSVNAIIGIDPLQRD